MKRLCSRASSAARAAIARSVVACSQRRPKSIRPPLSLPVGWPSACVAQTLSPGAVRSSGVRSAWMVKRSEIGDFGAAWLRCHGCSVGSETLSLSTRVQRAAPSLQMHPEESVVASRGPTKAVTLTMLPREERGIPL